MEYNYYNPNYEAPIEGMDIGTFEHLYVSSELVHTGIGLVHG